MKSISKKTSVFPVDISEPGLPIIARVLINNKTKLDCKKPLKPIKPANNSIMNETPTAGVKGAAAKNIQIKDIIIAKPIANLVIETPLAHSAQLTGKKSLAKIAKMDQKPTVIPCLITC